MTVLAVDDDPTQIELMKAQLKAMDYPKIEFLAASDMARALELANSRVIDLVLTDHHLPDGTGFDVLGGVKALNPMISVAVMTAYDRVDEAVSLLKAGADDYFVKPVRREDLARLVLRVNERETLVHEAFLPPDRGLPTSPAVSGIAYRGQAMAGMMSVAARAAESSATVLVTGESGTGKELVARFIHERSGRKGAFVAVNISALTESLAESELFGHSKGAFTGAVASRPGRFEEADGGTLFLDEIGEISAALQVKLLRAIQFGRIERVGENESRAVDARIVAATHRNLPDLVDSGSFRQDLYFRLNVIEIKLPPLRERKEDIGVLAERFLANAREKHGRAVTGISREAMDLLLKRRFPGNVRELENLIERAVVLSRGEVIRAEDIPPERSYAEKPESFEDLSGANLDEAVANFEKKIIRKALEKAQGNKSAAARELGVTERHLRSRIESLGMK